MSRHVYYNRKPLFLLERLSITLYHHIPILEDKWIGVNYQFWFLPCITAETDAVITESRAVTSVADRKPLNAP